MGTAADADSTAVAAEQRTLAAAIGAMSDTELAALFAQRPDLTRPLPEDLTMLAQQASTQRSVRLAWLRLNALQQQVLQVLLAHGGAVTEDGLLRAMGADPAAARAIEEALARCRALALLWDTGEGIRPAAALATLVGPYPCGLDPADRSEHLRIRKYTESPQTLLADLQTAPPGARDALERLLWGPPRGSLPRADRVVSLASAQTPVEWLLARELLVPDGADHVVLPREVALILRGGRYVASIALPPPPPVVPDAEAPDADATAGMHALATARTAARMLSLLDEGGTRVLRTGGIYQRDAAELSRKLQLDPRATALVADLLLRSGLIAADADTGLWGLTRTADVWRTLPEPRQWAVLVLAWRDSPAHTPPAAAEQAEQRILSDALESPGISEARQLLLQVAAEAEPCRPLDPELASAAVTWRQPRLDGRDLPALIEEFIAEAEYLGVLGRGAMTSAGRLLADPAGEAAAIAEAVAWPTLVDRLVVQADLTATALGPLTPKVLARIELLADLESAGAGTVYRFSAASLLRAFDAGMSTAEVSAELAAMSMTGVPGTLEALVTDVGRRHGAVRVSAAASVVTCDDDAALAAAIADPGLAHLRLHRVATGVALSTSGPAEVTAALRKAGVMAVSAHATAAARRRLSAAPPLLPITPTDAELLAAVRAVRAGTEARRALTGPDRLGPVGPHELVDTLQAAIRDRRSVWIDVTDATGTRRLRHVQPLTLRSGLLSGFDQREHRVLGFPLSRIAGIAVVAQSEQPL